MITLGMYKQSSAAYRKFSAASSRLFEGWQHLIPPEDGAEQRTGFSTVYH